MFVLELKIIFLKEKNKKNLKKNNLFQKIKVELLILITI